MTEEEYQYRSHWVGSYLPVVLGIEVVEDLDLGIGVDVGGESGGEDLGQQFVDSGHEGTFVHVLDQTLGLGGSALAVLHGELVQGSHDR